MRMHAHSRNDAPEMMHRRRCAPHRRWSSLAMEGKGCRDAYRIHAGGIDLGGRVKRTSRTDEILFAETVGSRSHYI